MKKDLIGKIVTLAAVSKFIRILYLHKKETRL